MRGETAQQAAARAAATVIDAISEDHRPYADRVTRSQRTVWCCTCDAPPEIGPINHLADNPDHYVVETSGDFMVWRWTR